MYKELSFTIKGVAPLILHNGQLADPLNEWAKKLKVVTSKRQKTDEDHIEMSRIEFLGGLYVDEKERPCIPGQNIESMLVEGGMANKLGKKFKAGVISDGFWPILYDGPTKPEKLWLDKRFVDRRNVPINGGARVQRTRPIFRAWSLDFKVAYLPDQLNEANVRAALQVAGRVNGLGDYTPKFGRFEVV